jgi:hypothetical protein
MARRRRRQTDEDLIALAGEYAVRRTYEPGDDLAEPDEVPPGPSGTVMSDAPLDPPLGTGVDVGGPEVRRGGESVGAEPADGGVQG